MEVVSGPHAAADVELRHVLREWVRRARSPPVHFLKEPNVTDVVLTDRNQTEHEEILEAYLLIAKHAYYRAAPSYD